MNRIMKTTLLISIFMVAIGHAQAETPRQQLTQMVQQLQQSPNDNTLREKLIGLAQTVKPAPSIPEDARRSFIKGMTFAKAATDPSQQKLAVDSFQEALKIAPWWGDAYYNLAVAQELAGLLGDAQASLKLYLLTNPGEKEARDAQDKIYALEAKAELAAKKQKQAEDETNRPEAIFERLLKSLDGGVWRCEHSDNKQYENGRLDADYCCAGADLAVGHTYIAVSGRTIRFYSLYKPTVGSNGMVNGAVKNIDYDPNATPLWSATLTSRNFKVSRTQQGSVGTFNDEITISNDGQSISDEETSVFTLQGNHYVTGGPINFVRMK